MPLGSQKGAPGETSWNMMRSELATELPVVAPLRLLDAPDVLVELLLREPGRPVDALEHRPVLVAPPVGAGRRQQLERLDVAGRRHVGSAAEVDEVTLAVEGRPASRPARGLSRISTLNGSPCSLVVPDRLLARTLLADDRVVRLREIAHALLEASEVLLGEGHVTVEVVVEAVLDGRARSASFTPGNSCLTAWARRCAVECRSVGRGSGAQSYSPCSRQMRVCLVRHSCPPNLSPGPALVLKDKNITKVTLRDAPRRRLTRGTHIRASGHPSRDVVRGRDGRFRTADLLCVRQALSH